MGRWSRSAVVAVAVTLGAAAPDATAAAPLVSEVMLSDVGQGFSLADEQQSSNGMLTRSFRSGVHQLTMTGTLAPTPPGVEAVFGVFAGEQTGFASVTEPSLELAAWLVLPGDAPGDGGFSALVVASRHHVFSIFLTLGAGAALDGPGFVLDLANRQVAAAGGGPTPVPPPSGSVDHADLLPLLPTAPPAGFDLGGEGLTVLGRETPVSDDVPSPRLIDFVYDRTKDVTRIWASAEVAVAIGITQFPYEAFAAAGLAYLPELEPAGIPADRLAGLPDAVTFREPDKAQVGIVFRRGDMLVTVLALHAPPADEARAAALAADAAVMVGDSLPPGATKPSAFPDPPSQLAGLGLTAAFITAAVAGSRSIARLRARRVRRRWSAVEPPMALPRPGSPPARVVELDADAAALRRRGVTVMGVQLLTVNVGVVALAGDFALAGVVVAAVAMLAGLGFSRWWLRRELALLGPSAPSRAFVMPRLSGAVLGVVALAVLGFGVAYLLKGVRYLILKPSLAQLRWSDLLGISPRAVGVLFALGGLAVTALGAVLYRAARGLARARVQQVLRADHRPPALYLRSFDDDSVPLPTIASARRPLFELFSLRGADPFEEAVAWELDSYGPVVAVGRPGGSLRSLGAAREHLSDETWRDQVAERMRHAGLVVLAPGETAGLSWELAEIVRGGHLDRSIFVFPPLAPAELARRWHHTADELRRAGADVGDLTVPNSRVHTLQVGDGGALTVTAASTRDEATYRTAVDRAVETTTPVVAPAAVPAEPTPQPAGG